MDRKSCSSISLYPVHVKDELERVENVFNDQVRVKDEVLVEVEHIKEEVEWEDEEDSADSYGVSEAPCDLYTGHEVKDELVLGPERLQPPDVAFALYAGQALAVKEEPNLRDCVVMLERTDDLEALLASTRWGTAGRGTAGRGTEDRGTTDRWPVGRKTGGRGTVGRGTVDGGTVGRETAGRGTVGRETAGRGTADRETVDCEAEGQWTEDNGMEARWTEARWTDGLGTEGRGTARRTAKRMSRKNADLAKEIHRNIKTMKNTYVCAICKLNFNLRTELMEHVMVHIHQSTEQESCDADEEEEIDVVSLGAPLPFEPCPLRSEERHTQRSRHTPRMRLVTKATAHEHSTVARYSLRAPYARSNSEDSETKAPKPERCHSIHNNKERVRRSQLRQLFDQLKEQIPATKNKNCTPKIMILREAVALCRRLREEQEYLEKQRRELIFKFRALRKKVVVGIIL